MLYAIIDVETTGGSAAQEKITEIAIVLHDGTKIIDTFTTLINPERNIPLNITAITGITNAMVADAPKFYEVAQKILHLTRNAVFVAHNVRFDFGFIREEFRRLGGQYARKQLCTVKLSRQMMPGLPSYSLTNLKKHLGIKAERSHRALDDTLATVQLFEHLLSISENHPDKKIKDFVNLGVKESKLPAGITMEQLHDLPEACGVYYFHDASGNVTYIGKSINIQKRVFEHFADSTDKGMKLYQSAHSLSYKVTGSELAALLLESAEIKRMQPPINRAQRIRTYQGAIFSYTDQNGYTNLVAGTASATNRKKFTIAAEYPKAASARAHLESLHRKHNLCQRLCHLDSGTGSGPCFYHSLHQCLGACIGEESAESYNQRLESAFGEISVGLTGTFVLLEKGRTDDENTLFCVQDGLFQGYGYLDVSDSIRTFEDAMEMINPVGRDPEAGRIIRGYMERVRVKRLVF